MLSILHREMRVASRERWTFRARLLTNVIAFVLCAPLIVFGSPGGMSGASIFRKLTVAAFVFCLIQGVRQASSSIADEKRDGTLGLLFLTDLSPFDIILGKMSSIVVPMVQPLLAFVPFLAISILLGGVTFGELMRVSLVFAAVILFSVAIGLFVSSASRRAEGTGNATLVFVVMLVAIPAILGRGPIWMIRLITPWTAFSRVPDGAFHGHQSEYWWPLLATFVVGLIALLAAAFFLPRRWERYEAVVQIKKSETLLKPKTNQHKRAEILDRSPGEWLTARYAMGGFSLFVFNFIIAILSGTGVLISFNIGGIWIAGYLTTGLASVLIYLRLASQSSYPLAEAKRSGAIEMMMATPLRPQGLIRGQLASLWRQFRISIGLVFLAKLLIVWTTIIGPHPIRGIFAVLGTSIGIVTSALTICSVTALGMWMGLREKSANSAFFKTVVIGLLAPLFFLPFCFPLPFVLQLVVLAVAATKLRGKELDRLLGADQTVVYQFAPPIIPAPPRIV